MNPTTQELFDEKNLRPGTVNTSAAAASAPSDTYADPTTHSILESKGLSAADPQSATSTPGHELPGAFPNKQELKPTGESITGTASNVVQAVTETVSNTAAAYLPAAAQYLPKSVVDTVSSYIPGSQQPSESVTASTHDVPHKKSMPSTELTGVGQREHVGGAGPLPGAVGEPGVAELPDAKHKSVPASGAGMFSSAAGALAGAATSAKDRVVGTTTGQYRASEHDRYHLKSFPSTEELGAGEHEHVGGVGALPGRVDESDVTELPEQKAQEDPYLTSAHLDDQPSPSSGLDKGQQAGIAAGALGAAAGTAYAVKDTLQGTAQDAKQRVLGAEGFTSGTETPGGHVTASVHDRPHRKSLPSSERFGAVEGERVGGVGSLPGRFDEPDVTELPEQKEKEDRYLTSAGMVTASTTIAPGPVSGRAGPKSSLPSQEEEGQKPFAHQAGVGELPGKVSESGVALLPEERAHPVGKWEHEDKDAQMRAAQAPVGKWEHDDKGGRAEDAAMADAAVKAGTKKHSELGLKEEQPTEKRDTAGAAATAAGTAMAAKETVGAAKDTTKDTAKDTAKAAVKGGSHGKPNQGPGYDTDYHPAQLHPLDADYSKERAEQEKSKEPAGEKESEKPLTGATHTDTTEGSGTAAGEHHETEKKKKSSFMAKVKGEAKVLLGKVEGKRGQEKVAEGERLKSGQSPTTTSS